MLVAFHTNAITERGASIAMYDYAHYNEIILENQSIVVTPAKPEDCVPAALQRFRGRFDVVHYQGFETLERDVLIPRGVDAFYSIKGGQVDGIETKNIWCCIHAVFAHHEPHGDVYGYVSEWLMRKMTGGSGRWVPHIIHPPASSESLRDELGIPSEAIVFGRHGGTTTFDIKWAQAAILEVARRRPDIHFVFLNTDLRRPVLRGFPRNIHRLPATVDPIMRSRFINTCDAMVHARKKGETFGLACLEFAAHNKPVVTCAVGNDLAHLDILKGSAIAYRNHRELVEILEDFKRDRSARWDVVSERFSPVRVMRQFEEVFLRH